MWLDFVALFTVVGSGYYGIECFYPIYVIKKLDCILVAWVLEVKINHLTIV